MASYRPGCSAAKCEIGAHDGGDGVGARPTDGRLGEPVGQGVEAPQGEGVAQAVGPVDVGVERLHPHAETLGDRPQSHALEAALLFEHLDGGVDHRRAVEAHRRCHGPQRYQSGA